MAKKRKQRLGEIARACFVEAGFSSTWEGDLTSGQCKRFPPAEKIGRGANATAYKSPDPEEGIETVVKFTVDKSDAQAARQLLGKHLKGAVRVFDVAVLKDQRSRRGHPVFGIKTELVDPLPQAWVDPANSVVSVLDDYSVDIRESLKTTGKVRDLYTKRMVKECQRREGDSCARKVPLLVQAVEELYANGVFSEDLHAGNWGMRGEQPVVLDFGISVSPKELPIDLAKAPQARRRR